MDCLDFDGNECDQCIELYLYHIYVVILFMYSDNMCSGGGGGEWWCFKTSYSEV